MQEPKELPKTRPPRSQRGGLPPARPPKVPYLSLIPLQSVPLKLRSRPPSPNSGTPQNSSMCSTRSSSSSKTIKRSRSLSEQRNTHADAVPIAPVQCSARSWAVTSGRTGKLLYGKGEDDPREIASLTKILTLYTALKLGKELDVSLSAEVTVSAKAASLIGTTAGLRAGDRLRLVDAMHGMMLPSGNDAAQCIAEYFGKCLSKHRIHPGITKDFDRLFIREMNLQCEKLSLRRSFFQNPHGMSIRRNHSTARDVNILASHALRHALFRSVVHAQVYVCKVFDKSDEERTVRWENTNKLLGSGYEGVKTGVTDAAGPCLCASWKEGDQRLIVTLLNSRSMEDRWEEVPRLVAWAREVFTV